MAAYSKQVLALNTCQQQLIAWLVVSRMFATVTGKRNRVLWSAFKAEINNMIESLARSYPDPLDEGATLQINDFEEREQQIAQDLDQPEGEGGDSWHLVLDMQKLDIGADIQLHSQMQAFAEINWPAVARVMRQPACFFQARVNCDTIFRCLAGLIMLSARVAAG